MRSIVAVLVLMAALGAAAQQRQLMISPLEGPAPAAVFDLNAAGRLVGSITPEGQANARATWWRDIDAAPVELSLLPGTNWSRAFGVNARGQIVGLIQDRSVSPPLLFAVFWESESAEPIALAGGTRAVAINSAGQIAGNVNTGTATHGAVWLDATSEPVDLGTFGGVSSSAHDLDDAGQVVGNARYADGSQQAAFWPSASEPPVALSVLSGATRSDALAINERGEIIGEAFFAATSRRVALFWAHPAAEPVELLSLGGASAQVVALDNRGRIVGWSQNPSGEMRACIWPSAFESPIDLGPGFARAINPRGTIAGEAGGSAVVWIASR